ncbi:MAG: ATP-dependent DNA ligase [Candidatus Woesearchaeota archaeon]
MDFEYICQVLESLENTSKRLEKTTLIATALKKASPQEARNIVLLLQGRIYPLYNTQNLGIAAQNALKAISISSGFAKKELLTLWKKTGDLGLVAHKALAQKRQQTLFSQTLTLEKVFANLDKAAKAQGDGSTDTKIKLLADLLSNANQRQAVYIIRLALEVLRIGVGVGTIKDALIWAYIPSVSGLTQEEALETQEQTEQSTYSLIELCNSDALNFSIPKQKRAAYIQISDMITRAVDIYNDIGEVTSLLAQKQFEPLIDAKPRVMQPLQVMLAKKVASVIDGFDTVGKPLCAEYKYDGFRLQIHKQGENISLFTRKLEDVTKQFPEVVHAVQKHVHLHTCILDCEAVGFDPQTKNFTAFQKISQRIRRIHDIEKTAKELPVQIMIFDILLCETQNMLDAPFLQRREKLEQNIEPQEYLIELSTLLTTNDPEKVEQLYTKALQQGHEGLMLKNKDAPYKPGSRVGYMVKLKPIMETLDLVITQASWGEGKRANVLTSFTLSCIDEDNQLREIGKVGTGFKETGDLSFEQMTQLLTPHILTEEGKDITVKPEIVLEIAYEEIQQSTTYSSGFALRFPRVIAILPARSLQDCSSVSLIEELYETQRNSTR